MKDEALKQALYALEIEDMACRYEKESTPEHIAKAITAIKQALAAPVQGCDFCNHPLYAGTKCKNCGRETETVQEPVAVVSGYYGGQCVVLPTNPARLFSSGTAFYTTQPAAQPAVPLTDEQIDAILIGLVHQNKSGAVTISRAIEAAHGITSQASEKGQP